MLPNFVIIGAQKAATTSLWHYLRLHPRVAMSAAKETNFFVAEMAWDRGLSWYESQFAHARDADPVAVGEASPNYTMYPELAGVPERMAKTIPEARLIYVLRHPIERMVSSYLHLLTLGSETRPIDVALLEEPHYANASRYAMQAEQYLRHFDPSRLLMFTVDELRAAPGPTLDRVLEFLALEPGWRPEGLDVHYHRTAEKRVPRSWWRRLGGLMIRANVPDFQVPRAVAESNLTTRPLTRADAALSDAARARLEDMVRPDVARLRAHLGERFGGWGLLS